LDNGFYHYIGFTHQFQIILDFDNHLRLLVQVSWLDTTKEELDVGAGAQIFFI
jgi:hypothetical protein